MASKTFLISLFTITFILLPILTQAAPFNFIENMKGSQKGDQVKGVYNIKKYLQHFGYLSYPNSANNHANDDYFDDLLEDAIRTFQANFHLNMSGTLDDYTIAAMTKPRCGVPDIVNGINRMRSGKNKHGTSMFHPDYAFFLGSPKWPQTKTRLTYGFSVSVPTKFKRPIAKAFRKWASVTHFSFSKARYDEADLMIAFARGDHGDGSPFEKGIIAHSFAPTDGRLHFNANEPWSIGAKHGHMDVGTTALHEIGHLLGLGHSVVKDAIMYPLTPVNTVKDLAKDDINGIIALYQDVGSYVGRKRKRKPTGQR